MNPFHRSGSTDAICGKDVHRDLQSLRVQSVSASGASSCADSTTTAVNSAANVMGNNSVICELKKTEATILKDQLQHATQQATQAERRAAALESELLVATKQIEDRELQVSEAR